MSFTHIPAELRRLVRQRADNRCEYCLIPESATFAGHELDHLIAEKHGGKTEADNLGLSCALCNGFKGSDISSIDPLTGQIVPLFHPRRDRWKDHFQVLENRIEGLTPTGRATAQLLRLNYSARVEERKHLQDAGLFKEL